MREGFRNFILLSIDALRPDHLSCYGYDRDTTPELKQIADRSVRYNDCYSVSSHTREAVPGLITGEYPDIALDADYTLSARPVSQTLSESGYLTAAFHSNPYLSRGHGYAQGFKRFDDDLYLGQNKVVAFAQRAIDKLRNRHYARAEEINERSLNWLDSFGDKPFFLWNHYMDSHGPYEPKSRFSNQYTSDSISDKDAQNLYRRAVDNPDSITQQEQAQLCDLYDAEIAYTDHYIGQFFDSLRDRGLLSESLIIVTADHGEAFGEHGYHSHPRALHEELTRVPLVVHSPYVDAKVISTPVSTLDIVPTILAAACAEDRVLGQPLSEAECGYRHVFQQVRGEGEKAHLRLYAVRAENGSARGAYDENTGTLKVVKSDGDHLERELKRHVSERRAKMTNTRLEADKPSVDTDVERRLKALGYKS